MSRLTIFFDAFLDGFTLAGFMGRLRRPSAATRLFAPDPAPIFHADEAEVTEAIRVYAERNGTQVTETEIRNLIGPILIRLSAKKSLSNLTTLHEGADHAAAR